MPVITCLLFAKDLLLREWIKKTCRFVTVFVWANGIHVSLFWFCQSTSDKTIQKFKQRNGEYSISKVNALNLGSIQMLQTFLFFVRHKNPWCLLKFLFDENWHSLADTWMAPIGVIKYLTLLELHSTTKRKNTKISHQAWHNSDTTFSKTKKSDISNLPPPPACTNLVFYA